MAPVRCFLVLLVALVAICMATGASASQPLPASGLRRALLQFGRGFGGGGGYYGGAAPIISENDAAGAIYNAVDNDNFGSTYAATQNNYMDTTAAAFPDDGFGQYWLQSAQRNIQ